MRKVRLPVRLGVSLGIVALLAVIFLLSVLLDAFNSERRYRPAGDEYINRYFESIKFDTENLIDELAPTMFEVDEKGIDGIFYISVSRSFSGDLKEIASRDEISRYVKDSNEDTEWVYFPAEYMPWIKAMGYGWLNDDGNLYAQMYGSETAKGKPNYRHKFSFIVKRNDVYYQVTCFCDTPEFGKVIEISSDLIYETCYNK